MNSFTGQKVERYLVVKIVWVAPEEFQPVYAICHMPTFGLGILPKLRLRSLRRKLGGTFADVTLGF